MQSNTRNLVQDARNTQNNMQYTVCTMPGGGDESAEVALVV